MAASWALCFALTAASAARASGALLRSSHANPADVVTGHLKGLVDGYLEKYADEEASFMDADAAMAKLINASSDMQAKTRAVDERLRLTNEHKDKLRSITGYIRTLDAAVQAMRPGTDDWKEAYPELKARLETIYGAYPVFLATATDASRAADGGSTMIGARHLADRAEVYLKYIGGNISVQKAHD